MYAEVSWGIMIDEGRTAGNFDYVNHVGLFEGGRDRSDRVHGRDHGSDIDMASTTVVGCLGSDHGCSHTVLRRRGFYSAAEFLVRAALVVLGVVAGVSGLGERAAGGLVGQLSFFGGGGASGGDVHAGGQADGCR